LLLRDFGQVAEIQTIQVHPIILVACLQSSPEIELQTTEIP